MDEKKYCTAIVLAAGSGKRMGTKVHKQYLLMGGKPVLYYSLRAFEDSRRIDEIILVTGSGEITLIVSAPDAEEASAVETYLNEKYPEAEFFVSLHTAQPLSDTTYVARTVIVGAIALVACFVYTAIRYRVSFALTQLVGSAATAALTLALNVICRIPAGEFLSVVTIAGILLYEILSFVFFEGAKKSFKEKTGLSAAYAVDAALASVSGAMGCVLLLGGIALAVLCAFTWYGLWLDLISALVATLVCAFTSLMLTPSVLAVCKKKTDVQDAKKAHFAYKG